MHEMKTFVTKILRNFQISLELGSEKHPIFSAEIALRPENPINFFLNQEFEYKYSIKIYNVLLWSIEVAGKNCILMKWIKRFIL